MTPAVAAPRKSRGSRAAPLKAPQAKAGRKSIAKKRVTPAAAAARIAAAERRRARTINRRLAKAYPAARCTLDHRSPLELLVATILSAQCTDERVNKVTPELFRKYPNAEAYADASLAELEESVRSTGFYRNKAKAIRGAAAIVAEKHGGKVPQTMEELLVLPGVARKTANVVLGNAYGQATGVVVDTHMHRVTRRLGLTEEHDPAKIERDLIALLPRSEWVGFSHRVIQHGRQICIARKPRCPSCVAADICPSAEL